MRVVRKCSLKNWLKLKGLNFGKSEEGKFLLTYLDSNISTSCLFNLIRTLPTSRFVQLHSVTQSDYIDVGDNFKMFVTVSAILITNIHYGFTLVSSTIIKKKIVNNFKSPTSRCHQIPCHHSVTQSQPLEVL